MTAATAAVLSVAEAATRLGVSQKTVRRWVKAGRLPAHLEPGPYGEQYRIPADALHNAQQVLDVVKVERPTDPRTLALAVAQAVEEKNAPVLAELAALRADLQALRADLDQRLPTPPPALSTPVQGHGEDSPPVSPRSRWAFWRRRATGLANRTKYGT